MAASGIAEHNEARRKELLMQKRAFTQKTLENNLNLGLEQDPQLLGTSGPYGNQDSYQREMYEMRRAGSPPGQGGRSPHDAACVDKMRRQEHRQQMAVDYSAKIPSRYSSIDYISQW